MTVESPKGSRVARAVAGLVTIIVAQRPRSAQLHDIAMANRIEILQNAKVPVEDLLRLLDHELGTRGDGDLGPG